MNVSHPHVTVDGTRITAEAAGCDANWHMYPDSGSSANGTMAKPESGAAAHTGALAALLVSASLALFA